MGDYRGNRPQTPFPQVKKGLSRTGSFENFHGEENPDSNASSPDGDSPSPNQIM